MMRRVLVITLVIAAGCMQKEHLPLEPQPESEHGHAGAAAKHPAIEKPEIKDYVYDRFTRADLISAANSRYGNVEMNITEKPDAALKVAEEARTYLSMAADQATQDGKSVEASYAKRAGDLMVKAVEEAKSAPVQSAQTLAAARRALDLAIEQVNANLIH
jgi:hypothetical protein